MRRAWIPVLLTASFSECGSEASRIAVGTPFRASVSAWMKDRFESKVPPESDLPSSNWDM
ncbi:hypothetical protein D3C78_1754510 [compost metagenome]